MPSIMRRDRTARLSRSTSYGDLGILVLSGDTAADAAPDFGRQTAEVLERIDGMLRRLGASRSSLLSVTLWVADMRHLPAVCQAWDGWIGPATPPALTIVEGRLATPGKLIEFQAVVQCTHQQQESPPMPEIQRLVPNAHPRFSRIVKYDNLIFLAGVTARDAQADLAGQCTQVFETIDRLLAEAGSDKHHILSATVWLADIAGFERMNVAWDAWVSEESPPARATVEARLAKPGLEIEIGIIAAPRG